MRDLRFFMLVVTTHITKQKILEELSYAGVLFVRSIIGIVIRPYESYRRISNKPHSLEILYVLLLVSAYFALASIVRISAFRPYLLTKQFILLCSGMGLGYIISVIGIDWIARKFHPVLELFSFSIGWAYTLIPTVVWFLFTSILYVILPPPRTERMEGILFSIVYLCISSILLFWKIQLGYLAIRFSYKLDAIKIGIILFCMLPAWGIFAFGMYHMGIFRIPFL
jgi:hypothetical protein